jgi:hypothetical protein
MFTWDELVALLSGIWEAWISTLLGIVGLVLTVVGLFWPNLPHARIFIIVGIVALILSPAYVWQKEYRTHRENLDKWERSKPIMSLIDAHVRYDPVLDKNVNLLTLTLDFKNIGQSVAEKLNLRSAWSAESRFAEIKKGQPQTSVNPINPGDIRPLGLRFSIPIQFVDHEGKQERAMKTDQLFIYLSMTYESKFDGQKRCQELWLKYWIGNPKLNDQSEEEKAKFEPLVRKVGFEPCPS